MMAGYGTPRSYATDSLAIWFIAPLHPSTPLFLANPAELRNLNQYKSIRAGSAIFSNSTFYRYVPGRSYIIYEPKKFQLCFFFTWFCSRLFCSVILTRSANWSAVENYLIRCWKPTNLFPIYDAKKEIINLSLLDVAKIIRFLRGKTNSMREGSACTDAVQTPHNPTSPLDAVCSFIQTLAFWHTVTQPFIHNVLR